MNEMIAVIYNSNLMTVEGSFDSVEDAEAALPVDVGDLVAALRSDYEQAFAAMRERRDSAISNRVENTNESRMTDLERYTSMRKMLAERPIFDSVEDARENMRAKDGEFRRFVIRECGALGMYRVCYCFLAIPRGSDTPVWSFNDEYSFTHAQMHMLKIRAATAVGLELIDSME